MTAPANNAEDSLSERISETTQRLAAEFNGRIPQEVIEDVARKSLDSYRHASVLDFVPLFVERYARESLQASLRQQHA